VDGRRLRHARFGATPRMPIPYRPHRMPALVGPAEHRSESIAYRLDAEGGAFVYTGDTQYSQTVVELACGADTLLIECSFPDEAPVPGHLTPSGVAHIASEAGVRRVVLTHIYPAAEDLDLVTEVGRGFEGEILVAEDGLEFEV
jgi:ribonuclease BN (tRNA processing enzyme)